MLPLRKNPLIYRNWCTFTRPGALWGGLVAMVALLVLGYAYIYANHTYGYRATADHAEILRAFCTFVLAIQWFLAFYVSLAVALESLVTERSRNTYDFFVSLPISTADKTIGLFLGSNLWVIALLVLLVPAGLISGLAGGFDLATLAWLYLLMLVAFLSLGVTGVAVSMALGTMRGVWILVFVLFALGLVLLGGVRDRDFIAIPLIVLGPYSFLSVALGDPSGLAPVFTTQDYHFYSIIVPWRLCPIVLYLFLGVLSFAAARRRLSKPSGAALSRWAVIVAFVVLQLLLIGFLSDSFQRHGDKSPFIAIGYLWLFFFVVLLWAGSGIAEYSQLMEWAEKKRFWPLRLVTESFSDRRCPPLVPTAVVWLVTVGTILYVDALYWKTLSAHRVLLLGLLLLCFLCAYQTLVLLGSQLSRRKGSMLGVLFVAIAIVVPAVLTSARGLPAMRSATPLGILIDPVPWDNGGFLRGTSPAPSWLYEGFAWSLGEFVVFGLLAAWQFRTMLAIAPRAGRLNEPKAEKDTPPGTAGNPS